MLHITGIEGPQNSGYPGRESLVVDFGVVIQGRFTAGDIGFWPVKRARRDMAVQKELLVKNKLVLIPFPVTLNMDAPVQNLAIVCGKISNDIQRVG